MFFGVEGFSFFSVFFLLFFCVFLLGFFLEDGSGVRVLKGFGGQTLVATVDISLRTGAVLVFFFFFIARLFFGVGLFF